MDLIVAQTNLYAQQTMDESEFESWTQVSYCRGIVGIHGILHPDVNKSFTKSQRLLEKMKSITMHLLEAGSAENGFWTFHDTFTSQTTGFYLTRMTQVITDFRRSNQS